SGLPSGRRGAGAVKSGLPSFLGIPSVGYRSHWADHADCAAMRPAAMQTGKMSRFIMAHTTARAMNRRQLLTRLVGGLLGGVALTARARAQQADVVRLNERLWLVTAGRTNVLALSTGDGLVVVDSGVPENAEHLVASLRQLAGGQRV